MRNHKASPEGAFLVKRTFSRQQHRLHFVSLIPCRSKQKIYEGKPMRVRGAQMAMHKVGGKVLVGVIERYQVLVGAIGRRLLTSKYTKGFRQSFE